MLREAEPLKREALAGCREVLGNRHPHTLASIANLADMLMQLGHADPRALEEVRPDHPHADPNPNANPNPNRMRTPT